MQHVQILHNPKAGDKDHSEEKLVALVKDAGYDWTYNSIKENNWHNFDPKADMIAVIGGDGTVRKLVKALLANEKDIKPIGILPMGTANNIAKTFHIGMDMPGTIQSWRHQRARPVDVVMVEGLQPGSFFLEGMSFGILPELMLAMKKIDKSTLDTPEKELKKALEVFLELTLSLPAQHCHIRADGKDIEGEFILAAAMNICSIGPNIRLADEADPGDGLIEISVVTEQERAEYAEHVRRLINDDEKEPYQYQSIKAKQVEITWGGTNLHTDDELADISANTTLKLNIRPSLLKFLTPR